jgi:hypothetical protein
METTQEIARKITLRTVGLDVASIKAALKDVKEGAQIELCKVAGVTTKAETGQTDKGEFIRLHGEFMAVNTLTGETFNSAQCILPTFLGQSLSAALSQSDAVEFALSIGARAEAKSVTGYSFTARPLIKAEASSRLNAVLQLAGMDKPAALPAPAPAEPAAEPAPAKAGKKA